MIRFRFRFDAFDRFALATALAVAATACATTSASAPTIDSVLQAHEDSLRAHREGDWEWFGRDMTDPSLVVSNGEVLPVTREQTLERFRDYLGRAEFTRYEDLEPPIVRMSPDGQMAWVIARVVVEGQARLDDGQHRELDSTWAWATLYERRDGRWVREANISTRVPEPPDDSLASLGSGLSATPSMSDDARALWREAQQAMGGVLAIEAVRSLTTVAAVSTPHGPGEMSLQSFADGRLIFDQLLSDGRRQRLEVLPGEDGDLVVDEDGTRPLEPGPSAFMRGHEFHRIVLAPALRFGDGRLGHPQRFDGRACEVIELVDAFGKPVKMFIDARTRLPAGFAMIEPLSEDDAPITVTLSDWKPFGTLTLFTALWVEHRGQRYDYDYRTIELNRP
ncbi:DUF4440 domain-containing protein [Paraliomyxa miuraensis]|uniref:DUF4440 domain-containing protein n=1 Tax=Paraliomyxa miuraensis TaxID=376150 RepID=UPI00224CF7FB|nr:DUF4440 domain-containing protein [Paraliomyxa miuraensis]MCX4247412.1 nuclear transport factor 2 family protein [Paraliomyxa miuraensis]